mgnify:CR=1 FL=1
MTNCIEIKELCKSYGDFALRNVDLVVPGGSIMGLIGENGAGKTTTIKCLLGMTRPDSGTVTVLGRDMAAHGTEIKQGIGVVLDECFYHDALRPRDLSPILAPIYRSWDGELYHDYLARYGLPGDKLIKTFSRGMKMKLSLAAALAHRPRLLVLDEATAGLDPVVREEILEEFLTFIGDEEHAILMSSHITGDLEKAADYITYLHRGQAVLSGSKDDIRDSYGRVACTAGQLEQIQPGDLLRVRRNAFGCEGLTAHRAEFQQKYPRLLTEPLTLEDIMLFMEKGEAL